MSKEKEALVQSVERLKKVLDAGKRLKKKGKGEMESKEGIEEA
jgi:hypothetical protein